MILFLSNGHGEDTVGAEIAARLVRRAPGLDVVAFPIVGTGHPYTERGIAVTGPLKTMPSGGFVWRRPKALLEDLVAGFGRLISDKIRSLKELAPEVDLVVGVGDKVILYLTRWILKKPLVFVGLADSAHYVDGRTVFTPSERRIMRRYAKAVYARDRLSAALLQKMDVRMATFVGNPMMDCFRVTGDDLGLPGEATVVGILPGSREEAYANLALILEGVREIHRRASRPMAYVVALAGNLKLDALEQTVAPRGWRLSPPRVPGVSRPSDPSRDPGVVAELVSEPEMHCVVRPAPATGSDAARAPGPVVVLTRGRFGDVISRAEVVIGLAGTANEQAAGLGKPIVTFPGTGAQITPKFVEAQTRLLGGAVRVTRPEAGAIAEEVLGLLDDPMRRKQMGAAGRERMGSPGAADRIVDGILEALGLGESEDPAEDRVKAVEPSRIA